MCVTPRRAVWCAALRCREREHRFDVRKCCVPKTARYEINLFYVIWISGSICRWQRQPRLVWFVLVIGRYHSRNNKANRLTKNGGKVIYFFIFRWELLFLFNVYVFMFEMNGDVDQMDFRFEFIFARCVSIDTQMQSMRITNTNRGSMRHSCSMRYY